MTRPGTAAVALGVLSAFASIMTIAHLRASEAGIAALNDRIASLEAGGLHGPSASAGGDLAGEVASLKKRIQSVSERPPAKGAPSGQVGPPDPLAELEAEVRTAQSAENRARAWVSATNQRVTADFTKALELSARQQEQFAQVLSPLLLEYWRARKGSDAQSAAKAGDLLREEAERGLKPLLTFEQRARFEELASSSAGIFAASAAAKGSADWSFEAQPAGR